MGSESKRHLYIAGGVVGASMAAHFFLKVRSVTRRVIDAPGSVQLPSEPHASCCVTCGLICVICAWTLNFVVCASFYVAGAWDGWASEEGA